MKSTLDYPVTAHRTTHYRSVSLHVTMTHSDATGGTTCVHAVDGNRVSHGFPVMHQQAKTAIEPARMARTMFMEIHLT